MKAALESAVRYLAYELGDKHIRVHAVSPGPLKTRAASGLKDFDVLLTEAIERAPIGELVDIDDVGLTAAYLTTPFARRLTGTTTYVDGGLSIMGRRLRPRSSKPFLTAILLAVTLCVSTWRLYRRIEQLLGGRRTVGRPAHDRDHRRSSC